MKKIKYEAVFGEIPGSFDRRLEHALHCEEKPMRKKRLSPVFLSVLITVLFTATAFAFVNQFHLLDFVRHYNGNNGGDVEPFLASEVEQSGGETENAYFKVREVAYTGDTLRFLVDAVPIADDVALVAEGDQGIPYYEDMISQYGERILGAFVWDLIPYTVTSSIGVEYSDGTATIGYIIHLSEDAPDEFTATLRCGLIDTDRRTELETTLVEFKAKRTGKPLSRSVDTQISYDGITVNRISIVSSPIELSVKVYYQEQTYSSTIFDILDTEGNVIGGESVDYQNEMSKDEAVSVILAPATNGIPEQLILWIEQKNLAMIFDVESGQYALHPTHTLDSPEQRTVVVDYDTKLISG